MNALTGFATVAYMARFGLPQFVLGGCVMGSLVLLGIRPSRLLIAGGQSVDDVVRLEGSHVQARLEQRFEAAGVSLPPAAIRLVGYKREKQLELWVRSSGPAQSTQRWRWIHTYRVKAASGGPGPKLIEGDAQVPEGLYGIEYLNPNSRFHLSMKLNYPNAFDLARAVEDGRQEPGTNIFIHGKSRSVGCLAIGDESIEELFVLAAIVGKEAVSVVLAPYRPNAGEALVAPSGAPAWTGALYESIDGALSETQR